VEEVVETTEAVAIEDLGGGVLAEEGVWAGVGVGVADANGDGVEIEADVTLTLGLGRDGRESENSDCGNAAKLHGKSSIKW
jgi:hypothetical protein